MKLQSDDLLETPLDQSEINFENDGGETYICGNPPYAGLSSQTAEQKFELEALFSPHTQYWKSFDCVAGWFWKARLYMDGSSASAAFVSTNSICQGQLVPMFWPLILSDDVDIRFAHTSFRWSNLAPKNATVTVVIVGISNTRLGTRRIFSIADDGSTIEKEADNISAYLVNSRDIYVAAVSRAPSDRPIMIYGNKPTDDGNLIFTANAARDLTQQHPEAGRFLRPYLGSEDFIRGSFRMCLWIQDSDRDDAFAVPPLRARFDRVSAFRAASKAKETRMAANIGHRFRQIQGSPGRRSIIIPRHSSETRPYLPVGLLPEGGIVSDAAFAIYDAPLWSLAVLVSRLHLTWVAAICGKLETRYRYSNTLGWNSFPIPSLTEKNKTDLAKCAEDVLLAREAHFPKTIADLYDPNEMPGDLRAAHERNDEVLERIYIGRRFRNDTERLEKLFELYTKMTANQPPTSKGSKRARA